MPEGAATGGRGLGGVEGSILGWVLNLKRHSPELCAPPPQAQTVCLRGPVLEPYPYFTAKNPRPREKENKLSGKKAKKLPEILNSEPKWLCSTETVRFVFLPPGPDVWMLGPFCHRSSPAVRRELWGHCT